MAERFEQFQEAVNTFNTNYGVNFSFTTYEDDIIRVNGLSSLFNLTNSIPPENSVYKETLLNLFKESVINVIDHKHPSVDYENLIKDFDKLMDNYRQHCKENGKPAPAKNGGMTEHDIYSGMKDRINDINLDKTEYAKERYLSGKLRLRDMRANLIDMRENGLTTEKLAQSLVYEAALADVVRHRSIWWKMWPGNWARNRAEQKDLAEIRHYNNGRRNNSDRNITLMYADAQVLQGQGVKGSVERSLERSIEYINEKAPKVSTTQANQKANDTEINVNNNEVSINDTEVEDKDTEIKENNTEIKENKSKITSNKKEGELPFDIDSVTDGKKDKKINEVESTKSTQKLNTLPKPKDRSDMVKIERNRVYRDIISNALRETLKNVNDTNANKDFLTHQIQNMIQDKLTDAWRTPENMQKHAMNIFKETYVKLNKSVGGITVGEKLVAAQKITDIMLNVYTPVASNKALAEYGDKFAIKNMDSSDIQSLTAYNGDVEQLMSDVKVELGLAKETIKFAEGTFKDDTTEKSQKVQEFKAPTQSKIKD